MFWVWDQKTDTFRRSTDITEWDDMKRNFDSYNRVGDTYVGLYRVSTVFLYLYVELQFETLITSSDVDSGMTLRWSTSREAYRNHKRIVELLYSGVDIQTCLDLLES